MTAPNSSLNNAENKEQMHNDSSNTAQNDVPDSVTEVAQTSQETLFNIWENILEHTLTSYL
ncbi:hypothetical protein C8R11_102148 [Nitrosomonas aestuarii]|nr:hypothetical protein C8R11_102148 [Nitrosomonas aestuarii]